MSYDRNRERNKVYTADARRFHKINSASCQQSIMYIFIRYQVANTKAQRNDDIFVVIASL